MEKWATSSSRPRKIHSASRGNERSMSGLSRAQFGQGLVSQEHVEVAKGQEPAGRINLCINGGRQSDVVTLCRGHREFVLR